MRKKDNTTAGAGVKLVGFAFNKEAQGKKEEVGRISHFITQHLKDPREATLFDTAEQTERDRAVATYNKDGIKFMGQNYTNSATHTLFGLSYILSMERGEDIDSFREATKEQNIPVSKYISRSVPITELCHLMYGDRRSKNIAIIIRDIMQLASIPVAWHYNLNGQERIKIAPLLHYEFDYPRKPVADKIKKKYGTEPTEKEVTISVNKFLRGITDRTEREKDIAAFVVEAIKAENSVNVTFGRAFFQDLNLFAYVPQNLITEWGKDGTGTQNEVFPLLLNELLFLYPQYRYYAGKAKGVATNEARKDKLTREQRETLVEERVERTLTGEVKLATIDERLGGAYFKKRNYNKLKGYVDDAMRFFKDNIGLITKYYFTGKTKDLKIYFVFNTKYGSKAALPAPEEPLEEAEVVNE